MTDWFIDHGDIIWKVVMALSALGSALLLLRWRRRLVARSAASARARLGEPLRDYGDFVDGRESVLSGRLIVLDEPTRRIDDDGPAGVITLRPRYGNSKIIAITPALSPTSRRAEKLALRIGDIDVPLLGPIDLVSGARVCRWARTPRALPRPLGGRIESIVGADGMNAPIEAHSIGEGDRIRISGTLRAVAAQPKAALGYREASIAWELIATTLSTGVPAPMIAVTESPPDLARPRPISAVLWGVPLGLAACSFALGLIGDATNHAARERELGSIAHLAAMSTPWGRDDVLALMVEQALHETPTVEDLDLARRAAVASDRSATFHSVGEAYALQAQFEPASRLYAAWWRTRPSNLGYRGFILNRHELASHLLAGDLGEARRLLQESGASVTDECLTRTLFLQGQGRGKAQSLLAYPRDAESLPCTLLTADILTDPAERLQVLQAGTPTRGALVLPHWLLRFEANWHMRCAEEDHTPAEQGLCREVTHHTANALRGSRSDHPPRNTPDDHHVTHLGLDDEIGALAPVETARVLELLLDDGLSTELLDLRALLHEALARFALTTDDVSRARHHAAEAEHDWILLTTRHRAIETAALEAEQIDSAEESHGKAEEAVLEGLRASTLRIVIELRNHDIDRARDLLPNVSRFADVHAALSAWISLLDPTFACDASRSEELLRTAMAAPPRNDAAGRAIVGAVSLGPRWRLPAGILRLHTIDLIAMGPRVSAEVRRGLAMRHLNPSPRLGPGAGARAVLSALSERLAIARALQDAAAEAEAQAMLHRWREALTQPDTSIILQVLFNGR